MGVRDIATQEIHRVYQETSQDISKLHTTTDTAREEDGALLPGRLEADGSDLSIYPRADGSSTRTNGESGLYNRELRRILRRETEQGEGSTRVSGDSRRRDSRRVGYDDTTRSSDSRMGAKEPLRSPGRGLRDFISYGAKEVQTRADRDNTSRTGIDNSNSTLSFLDEVEPTNETQEQISPELDEILKLSDDELRSIENFKKALNNKEIQEQLAKFQLKFENNKDIILDITEYSKSEIQKYNQSDKVFTLIEVNFTQSIVIKFR